MADQSFPITPPPELVQQWKRTAPHRANEHEHYHYITLCAAQWGAEQELEACCEWAKQFNYDDECYEDKLRAALATPPPEPPTPCIKFCAPPLEEVIRLDKEGFHYKGQFIADAGEAHRLMLVFLKQHAKVEPEPPTDQEIEEWADTATEVPLEAMDPDINGWQRCFTKEEFCASIRAALERWGQ
jgi:hypothetical protein